VTSRAPDPRDDELRALARSGEIDRATVETIEYYGAELVGWLCSILPDEADAHDAFSRMSEQLWRSLPTFEGRCSIRAWCYMLARQAASRVRNETSRQHEELMSHVPSVVGAVTHVWSTTRVEREREESVYTRLRKSLAEDDQLLLVLRVDRELSWREIAIVILGDAADEDQLERRAAALRKQFERIKAHLRELAR
jgi:RNA polymerase sigma-70 factor (ECF subfamily)